MPSILNWPMNSESADPECNFVFLSQRLAAKGTDREVARQVLDEIYTREYTSSLVEQARAQILKKGKAGSEEEILFELKKLGFSNYDVANGD